MIAMKKYKTEREKEKEGTFQEGVDKRVGELKGGYEDKLRRRKTGWVAKHIIGAGETSDVQAEVELQQEKKKLAEVRMKEAEAGKIINSATGQTYYEKQVDGTWKDRSGNLVAEDRVKTAVSGVTDEEEKNLQTKLKKAKRSDDIAKAYAEGGGNLVLGAIPAVFTAVKREGTTGTMSEEYTNKQVQEKKDSMKDDSESKVMSTLVNEQANVYERMASLMTAMDKGWASVDDVTKHLETLKEKIDSGVGGSWNNKKLAGQLDVLKDKNYKSLTTMFKNLAVTGTKGELARRTVKDRLADGTYTLKNLGGDAIKQIGTEIGSGLKMGSFIKQFKDLDDAKKEAVKTSLTNAGTDESLQRLARVTDMDKAFSGNSKESELKTNFLQSLSMADLKEIVESKNEAQIKAIAKALSGGTSGLSESVQRTLESESGVAREVRSAYGISNSNV